MKKLYFLRHGLTDMNVSGHFSGHSDAQLTEVGKQQAITAGKQAKAEAIKIDLIVCSPLSRAHNTAKLFAKEIGYPIKQLVTNPLLIERYFGELEGTQYKTDIDRDGIVDYETDQALILRAEEALSWVNSLGADSVLIVAHGAIGRAIRSILKLEYPMSHPEVINNAELLCWVEG